MGNCLCLNKTNNNKSQQCKQKQKQQHTPKHNNAFDCAFKQRDFDLALGTIEKILTLLIQNNITMHLNMRVKNGFLILQNGLLK